MFPEIYQQYSALCTPDYQAVSMHTILKFPCLAWILISDYVYFIKLQLPTRKLKPITNKSPAEKMFQQNNQ